MSTKPLDKWLFDYVNGKKRCRGCLLFMPPTEQYFGRNQNEKDGLNRICKECNSIRVAGYPPRRVKPKLRLLIRKALAAGIRDCYYCKEKLRSPYDAEQTTVKFFRGSDGKDLFVVAHPWCVPRRGK